MVERARPLLGTRVAIRVHGLAEDRAHRAIDAAFREIEQIHSRMSFHERDSDVSRLNREAFRRPVPVDPRTWAVLALSRELGERSGGCFDVTVAPRLVEWGWLPRPDCPHPPDPAGSWRDVELLPGGAVRFHRRVWIDLGGIAKGYAVDRAIECLEWWGVRQCCVNAGGDLRVRGPEMERIRLDWRRPAARVCPILEVENGSVASSRGTRRGPHVLGHRRHAAGARAFASVVAERCVVADALTKVVLGRRRLSASVLARYGASAYLYRPDRGWQALAAAP